MDWLRNYEGKRGIGYLIILISSLAPSYCALFLLKNELYEKSDSAQAILTTASLGTLIGLLLTMPMTFLLSHGNKRLDDHISSVGIGFGFWMSLAIQVITMLIALMLDKNFYWYFSGCIIETTIIAAIIWIIVLFSTIKAEK